MLGRRVRFAFCPSREDGKEATKDGQAGGAPEEGFDGANSLVAQNDILAGVNGVKPHEELNHPGCQHDQHKNENLSLPRQLF